MLVDRILGGLYVCKPEGMSGPPDGTANRKCEEASRNLTSTEI
jgi:hypothetical protein